MGDLKARVQGHPHLFHHFTEVAQAFKSKVLALHGGQDGIRCHEGVDG